MHGEVVRGVVVRARTRWRVLVSSCWEVPDEPDRLLCQRTRDGVGIDFGRGAEIVTDAQGDLIHGAHPRLGLAIALVDAVTEQARRTPSKAPAFSAADAFLLERAVPPHLTRLERAAATSRWGR